MQQKCSCNEADCSDQKATLLWVPFASWKCGKPLYSYQFFLHRTTDVGPGIFLELNVQWELRSLCGTMVRNKWGTASDWDQRGRTFWNSSWKPECFATIHCWRTQDRVGLGSFLALTNVNDSNLSIWLFVLSGSPSIVFLSLCFVVLNRIFALLRISTRLDDGNDQRPGGGEKAPCRTSVRAGDSICTYLWLLFVSQPREQIFEVLLSQDTKAPLFSILRAVGSQANI